MSPTEDRRAKGRTGYPEPGVDEEDTGVITPGRAYHSGDGSVRDPRNPPNERSSGAGPRGPRGPEHSEEHRGVRGGIDRKNALERVRGRRGEK